jgi:phage terminase Nu1 subunit (DNA packaging protein)
VTVDGAPKIADLELADREWEANTRPSAEQRAATPSPEEAAYRTSRAAREAMSLRRETAEAELAEIQLAERRGQMVSVDAVRRDTKALFALTRNRLLGVPSAFAQRLPLLAPEAAPVIEELIRDALQELANDDIAGAAHG